MFTFLSYGYAVHASKGVKASSEEIAQHTHQVQDHEAEQLTVYTKVEELASQPDLFDEPNTQGVCGSGTKTAPLLCTNKGIRSDGE